MRKNRKTCHPEFLGKALKIPYCIACAPSNVSRRRLLNQFMSLSTYPLSPQAPACFFRPIHPKLFPLRRANQAKAGV